MSEPDEGLMPLDGLRVIELGHIVAGPFAATMLGDFGADVIKVERPGAGDGQRSIGPSVGETPLWFSVLARNKRSMTLDLSGPEGRDLMLRLLDQSDVLVENFRPGVLERLGLGPDVLLARRPELVILRVSGFGQSGPYRDRRGFGKVAEAYSGATNLTGFAGSGPVHPGYSLGDLTTGLMGAFGVLLALEARRRTGRGQVIDLALYEALLRMIDWQLAVAQLTTLSVTRLGNSFPFEGAFATDIYPTRDGQYLAISASSPRLIRNLCQFVESMTPDGSLAGASLTQVTARLGEVVSALDLDEAQALTDGAEVISWPVFDPARLAADPHIAHRRNFVAVRSDGVDIPMPAALPQLSETPGRVRAPGPRLGQHTEEILRDLLQLTPAQTGELRARQVI
jgi:crotonobetainyl-CoA:carnitine CoA-transferase CaiB-like acyl-CoA transferase